MSEIEIRNPIQKRSIETKEKIINAGFDLICNNGYYNTNTSKIAKKAGVSTGIIYQYFKDKHDILMAGLDKYADSIFFPMINLLDIKFNKDDFSKIINKIIRQHISNHKLSKIAHEEIMAMIHSDKEIASYYYKREIDTIQTTFDSSRTNPPLQRNMPKISGRIKWAKHLFNRIFPFINQFKDIA